MTSIRQRLTRRLLLTLAALVSLGALAAFLCARAALVSQFDAALRARADALVGLVEQHGDRVEMESADELLRDYAAGSTLASFQLWRTNGSSLLRSPSLGEASLPRPASPLTTPQFYEVELPGDLDARALAVAFTPRSADSAGASPREPLLLIVALNREPLDRTLATLQLVFGATGVALLVAIACLVPPALRRELQPLDAFAEQAARIDSGSLHTRFAVDGLPAELLPVATRLNELLARLEATFDRERRFTADVAHEFRTPLAELRALAELSLKLPDTRTAQTDADTLAIAQHLESITTRLLALARGERGELAVHRERVAIAPLLTAITRHLQPQASTRRLTLTVRVPADAHVETDAALLRSILANLADNAVAYSREGTTIELTATAGKRGFVLAVANTPADLAPDDVPNLCERFWRKDPARITDGHAGLGLALAQTFAHALGTELDAQLDATGRLTLSLRT